MTYLEFLIGFIIGVATGVAIPRMIRVKDKKKE